MQIIQSVVDANGQKTNKQNNKQANSRGLYVYQKKSPQKKWKYQKKSKKNISGKGQLAYITLTTVLKHHYWLLHGKY